jgi:hypothetical protein
MMDMFVGSMLYSTAIAIGSLVPARARTVHITVKAAAVCKNLRRSIILLNPRTLFTGQANITLSNVALSDTTLDCLEKVNPLLFL